MSELGRTEELRPKMREALLTELIEWVDSRIEAEVTHRPDQNIYKKTLAQTWDQMKRELTRLRAAAGEEGK